MGLRIRRYWGLPAPVNLYHRQRDCRPAAADDGAGAKQNPGGSALRRDERVFPENAVEYFVSYYDYYQPEAYVPSSDTFIEKDASVNEHIEQMRLSATSAARAARRSGGGVSLGDLRPGDPDLYLKMMLHLTVGMLIDQRAILRRLAELQYTRNDQAFQRAALFRVRGEVIDVFRRNPTISPCALSFLTKRSSVCRCSTCSPATSKGRCRAIPFIPRPTM